MRYGSSFAFLIVGLVSLLLGIGVVGLFMPKKPNTVVHAQEAEIPPPPPPPPMNIESEQTEPTEQSNAVILPQGVSFLEPYVFDTREGRRNPFRPPSMVEGENADLTIGPGTPLERYEVDEIKLSAILWDIKNPKAMFIDPTGEVHILTKDDRIGRRRGFIATIRESEVVIVEVTSFSGQEAYATRILRMDK